MKKIPLYRHGKVVKYAKVDDCDYEWLMKSKWYLQIGGRNITQYARRGIRRNGVYSGHQMHRLILGLRAHDGVLSDHINGDGLDNRRSNLRKCSMTQNLRNRGRYRTNTVGFRGVTKKKRGFAAQINDDKKKRVYLGTYRSPREAYAAYLGAARIIHGEFFRDQL